MKRIPLGQMQSTFEQVLLKYGFDETKAALSAKLIAETSLDGTYSHGLNRVPRLINTIKSGYVIPANSPKKVSENGSMQVWDGQSGPGNTNAYFCMEKAMEIAKENGIGLVALRNTNHWMRGGAFGWQAANKGMAAICWTNTEPNMPAWGASEKAIGNNPLIIAIPREKGHLVLDMAMSQFSFGKIEQYKREGKALPLAGGFDQKGNLTTNAALIEDTMLALPIGYWKGAGLSLMLDLLAALLAGGKATNDIGFHDEEYGLSQVFIALDITQNNAGKFISDKLEQVIEDLHTKKTFQQNGKVYYPGERTKLTREENLEKGIPVDEGYWEKVLGMLDD